MKEDLKELIVIEGMPEAEVIKSKLESFGIPSLLRFESAGRLFGISMNGLGKVKVMVFEVDFDKAREIIEVDEGGFEEEESEE